jgi:predicted nuclease of predicted toxin-antitoxin system
VHPRFLADASLNNAIVTGTLRAEPSIDFLSAHAAGLEGVPDDEVRETAAEQGRILVTHDLKTMPAHFGRFAGHSTSPGIILISQRTPVAEAIESLLLVWLATGAAEWVNRICKLPF